MQTPFQKLAFGTGAVDWQQRIDMTRLRQERAERTRKMMKKHGVAAMLLTRDDNIRYALSVKGPGGVLIGSRYAVVFAEHDPIMYEAAATVVQHRGGHVTWVKPENMRCAYSWMGGIVGPNSAKTNTKKFAAAVKNDLQANGLASEPLAVDAMDEYGRAALTEAGIKLADARPVMAEARLIKTADEVNCLRMAAALVDVAWYAMYEVMKPGATEREIAAVGIGALHRAGAEGITALVLKSGPNCFEDYRGVSPTDRIIQVGDTLFSDFGGASYLGYRTCYYRTFMVGRRPTQKEKDWYKKMRDTQYAVLEAVKPGNTTADAAKGFRPASVWGYDKEEELYMSEVAHGIGLSLYERPVINRLFSFDDPQPFEPGMTFAIETRDGETGVGGARMENMILVTDKGYEILSRMPDEEIIVVHHSLLGG